MPALVLFNRRWLISGDDLVFPAIQLTTFNFVWVVTLPIWLAQAANVADTCPSKPYYVGVVGSMLATCALSVVLEPAVAYYGSRGGMFETRKRSPMLQRFIYADLAMSMLRVCIVGYGTHVLYSYPSECLGDVGGSLAFSLQACYRACIWSMWAMIGGLTCFCVLVFNWFPEYHDTDAWVRQFQYWSSWFCCVSGTRREVVESFRRVGEMFGMMFRHIDLVPSDVLTIFCLAMLRQRDFRLEEAMTTVDGGSDGDEDVEKGGVDSRGFVGLAKRASGIAPENETPTCRSSSTATSSPTDTVVDRATIEEVAYYMRYAFAVYGWMLFVWSHPGSGMVRLCCGDSCRMWADCASCSHGAPMNAKYLNREAILKTSRLHPADLLHVQLESGGKDVLPYFIGLDHGKKKLIIAIRGSMSFDDVVRDLKFDPASVDGWLRENPSFSSLEHSSVFSSASSSIPMSAPGPPDMNAQDAPTYLAHRGIFEAAKATMASIDATGLLNKHLDRHTGTHRDYDILVCGHSLGAGCAFLVGLYLRQSHPSLRCISFSPPGGLVSRNLASSATLWCISTVCGKEWVPRITLATIEQVRDDMVHLGVYCKMSKAKLILSWLTDYLWSDNDVFYSEDALPEENAGWLRAYRQSVKAADDTDEVRKSLRPAVDFYPPGRIMYMKPTGNLRTERNGGKKIKGGKNRVAIVQREFVCEWTTSERLVRNGILLSGRMMKDHFPDVSYAILKVLADGGDDSDGGDGGGGSATSPAASPRRYVPLEE